MSIVALGQALTEHRERGGLFFSVPGSCGTSGDSRVFRCENIHTHARTHAPTHARTQTRTHTNAYAHTHAHTHIRTHIHARTHSHTQIRARVHTHTHAATGYIQRGKFNDEHQKFRARIKRQPQSRTRGRSARISVSDRNLTQLHQASYQAVAKMSNL